HGAKGAGGGSVSALARPGGGRIRARRVPGAVSKKKKKKRPPPRPGKGPRRGRMLFVSFGMFRRAEAVRRLLRWRRWRLRRPDTLEVEVDQLSPEKVESEPHDRPDFADAVTTSSRAANPYPNTSGLNPQNQLQSITSASFNTKNSAVISQTTM